MSERADVYSDIMKSYERARDKNNAERKKRYEKICALLPEVAEIDKTVEQLGLEAVQAVIKSPEKSDEIYESLNKEVTELKIKKEAVIGGAFPKDYLEVYDCPLCRDTGYVGNEKCICLKNKLLEENYNMSAVKDITEKENFATFCFDYYSDKVYPEYEASPRENIGDIYKNAIRYCETFGSGENLLFFGEPGLGKTFLCNCISKYLLDKGFTVIYVTAWQLFKKIADATFRCDDDKDVYRDIMEDILSCDLLIIDDLGTEFVNSFSATEFFNIINQRLSSKKSVILSTNLDTDVLTEKYSDRVISRIMGGYTVYGFFGDDIRPLKKYGEI